MSLIRNPRYLESETNFTGGFFLRFCLVQPPLLTNFEPNHRMPFIQPWSESTYERPIMARQVLRQQNRTVSCSVFLLVFYLSKKFAAPRRSTKINDFEPFWMKMSRSFLHFFTDFPLKIALCWQIFSKTFRYSTQILVNLSKFFGPGPKIWQPI